MRGEVAQSGKGQGAYKRHRGAKINIDRDVIRVTFIYTKIYIINTVISLYIYIICVYIYTYLHAPESHGLVGLGVVSGGSDGAEDVMGPTTQHQVHTLHHLVKTLNILACERGGRGQGKGRGDGGRGFEIWIWKEGL